MKIRTYSVIIALFAFTGLLYGEVSNPDSEENPAPDGLISGMKKEHLSMIE